MTTEDKDAEIERLKEEVELHRNGEFDDSWQYQCQENERLEKEIERLKGELAEAKHLLADATNDMSVSIEGTRAWLKTELAEAIRLLKPMSDKAEEANKFRHPIGSACEWRFEVDDLRQAWAFLQKHTPPLNCGVMVQPTNLLSEARADWEKSQDPMPLNGGIVVPAGESPSHSGGGEPKCICEEAGYTKHHPYCPAGFADRKAKQ